MKTYTITDEGNITTTVDAESMEDACTLAVEWLSEGEWTPGSTVSATVEDEDGNVEYVAADADADEPECSGSDDGDHDWHEDEPRGRGTAVVHVVTCRHCGCRRTEIYDPLEGDSVKYEFPD